MPLVVADRVRETTTTTGTGTITLAGAVTGYQSFSAIGNGNTTYYTINAGSQWEVGIGTYLGAGPTLSRDTVLESSNSGSLVDFAAGTKDVFVTYPAEKSISDGYGLLPVPNGGTGVTTSTGTGSVVLSNSPTFVTPTLGAASATSIANGLGTVGAPSYTFTGDTNTGIFSPAADTIAFSEGGAEAMRIDSSGNVGIGTSSPGSKLQIAGTGGEGFVTVSDNTQATVRLSMSGGAQSDFTMTDLVTILRTNAGQPLLFGTSATERMRIDASGNVGIGTALPSSKLHVAGALTLDTALSVGNGGTGASTLTGVVVGNGTSAFTTVTAPSGAIVGTTDTQTLTNKRVTPRMNSQSSTASPFAWNSDSYDTQAFTALANALTINADAGTPTDGQRTIFRFEDNGVARALTWTTGATKAFRAVGVTLPTTTVVGKVTYVGCIYNTFDSRWDAVAVSQEA